MRSNFAFLLVYFNSHSAAECEFHLPFLDSVSLKSTTKIAQSLHMQTQVTSSHRLSWIFSWLCAKHRRLLYMYFSFFWADGWEQARPQILTPLNLQGTCDSAKPSLFTDDLRRRSEDPSPAKTRLKRPFASKDYTKILYTSAHVELPWAHKDPKARLQRMWGKHHGHF